MRAAILVFAFLLISCSRPLTPGERAFVADMHGPAVDPAPVRISRNAPLGVASFKYEKRPRLSCRERIFPEPSDEIITTSPAGVVLGNHLYTSRNWSLPDYLPDYPAQLNLTAALYFAHEMTHIWQWQNRELTGYSVARAAQEHAGSADPYLFDLGTDTKFLNYAYEQQASVVEEYLCCALLDPQAPRTTRLRNLVSEVFPTDQLPRPEQVILPWDGAQIRGICR